MREREALDRTAGVADRINAGAWMRGLECVADQDRQTARDSRRHRLRMNDFRAEVGQFAGLVVAHRGECYCLGFDARIGAEHAVDIGPDMQFLRFVQCGKNRTRIIAAVASEHGVAAFGIARDIAGDDHARLHMLCAPRGELRIRCIPVDGDAEFLVAHDEHVACIEQGVIRTLRVQQRVQQVRRPDLSIAADRLGHAMPGAAQHGDRIEHVGQFVEVPIEPLACASRSIAEQLLRRIEMAFAQHAEFVAPLRQIGRRRGAQREQRVGNALHRRDDDDLGAFAARANQFGHMADTHAVGQRGAAELVRNVAHRARSVGGSRCCCRGRGGAGFKRGHAGSSSQELRKVSRNLPASPAFYLRFAARPHPRRGAGPLLLRFSSIAHAAAPR